MLGPVRLVGDVEMPFPRGQVGTLLGHFLVRPNETQSAARLLDVLWPGDGGVVEDRLRARLQLVVSRLRRFVGAEGRAGELRVVTDRGGYRLDADAESLDSVAFEALAARVLTGERELVSSALALWEGSPYGELVATPDVRRRAAHLVRLRTELERIHEERPRAFSIVDGFARTKFVRPRADSEYTIPRHRLRERAGRVGDCSVLVVTAPGGFGKTVFLSQWAEAQPVPVAWVNLEPADNDPVRFWSAILAAFAEAGTVDLSAMPEAAPGSRVFVEQLESVLARHGTGVGLVLDDVHTLDDPTLLRRLHRHLARLPEWVTVALGSRVPLSLDGIVPAGVRALSGADLAFTPNEIEAVMRRGDPDLSAGESATVARMTDAWPVAVSYLSRSGARPAEPDLARDLEDYVVDEVLLAIPERRRGFLLATAHLEWLHASLCDAVRSSDDSEEHLAWLRRHELFLTGTQTDTGWFRYHHLIADVLRRRADADPSIDVAEVRRRAARWCRQEGLDEAALRYGIAAGDHEVVAELAGPVVLELAMRREMHACDRLIAALDPDVVARNRTSHDAVMLGVSGWSDPERAERWVASRRQYGEDADVMVMGVQSHRAMMEGRPREALEIFDATRTTADAYFEFHPQLPGLREAALGTLEMASVCVPILMGALRAGDEEIEAIARQVRSHPPLAAWVLGDLAFLAYVDGDSAAAQGFMDEVEPILATMDPQSIELGSTRAIVTRALLDSDATDDPAVQRRIAEEIVPLVRRYERLRWRTELIAVLIALHVTCHRAGEFKQSASHAAYADLLLGLCGEVQLLRSARERLDLSGEASSRSLVGAVDPVALTERQLQVLTHLDSGMTYAQIAESLGTTLTAVQSVVRALYAKLGVHNRYDARRVLHGAVPGGHSMEDEPDR